MRFNTPCSRIRSSLVETSSSCSLVLAVLFCTASAAKGWAKPEAIKAVEVRTRKVRLGVSIDPSFSSVPWWMCASAGAKAHKPYCSFRMLSVNRREEIRLAVKGNLPSESGSHPGNPMKVVIIAQGVSLHARQEALGKSRRLRLFAEQQLVGAIDILDPRPHSLNIGEAQSRFGKVAVEILAGRQEMISSPDERAGPITAAEGTVVHDGRGHPLYVIFGVQLLGAGQVGEGVLRAPILRGLDSEPRRPRVNLAGINVPAELIRLASMKAGSFDAR